MRTQLTDFAMFADFQDQLGLITAKMRSSLPGGRPLPNGAILLGKMPTPMKTLLCLIRIKHQERNSLGKKCYGLAMTDEHDSVVCAQIDQYQKEIEFLNRTYWEMTYFLYRESFDPTIESIGFGPKFEFYKVCLDGDPNDIIVSAIC